MSSYTELLSVGTLCGIISIVLSFCLPRQSVKLGVRLSPLFLQILLIPAFVFPCLHGTPSEVIIPTGLTFVWAVFVFGLCRVFYKFPSDVSRGLAVVLFVEGVAFVLLSALSYSQSCLFYGHKFFSSPWT